MTAIVDNLDASDDRSFDYRDPQYFLTSAAGPWPGPLSWSYDRIGNRLTETRGSSTDSYVYAGDGHTPVLDHVELGGGVGGSRGYTFDDGGNLSQVNPGANQIDFTTDDAGRLAQAARTGGETAYFRYDGRGFLALATNDQSQAMLPLPPALAGRGRLARRVDEPIFSDGFESGDICAWSSSIGGGDPNCPSPPQLYTTVPHYGSDGLLYELDRDADVDRVLYFAGRPVALLQGDLDPQLTFLTTDHLGTPVYATDQAGAKTWSLGFEPFGEDWQAGTGSGASTNGIFLRLPGQWTDPSWEDATLGAELYQNTMRWLELPTARYSRPDPLMATAQWQYGYARQNPMRASDPLGLYTIVGDNGTVARAFSLLRRLMRHDPDKPCTNCRQFFDSLGLDPQMLVPDGGFPYIYTDNSPLSPGAPYGAVLCNRGGNEYNGIYIDKRVVKNAADHPQGLRCLASKIAHELAHYLAKHCSPRDPEGPEGQEAETACFGGSPNGASQCGY